MPYDHFGTSRVHDKTGEEEEHVTSADFGPGRITPVLNVRTRGKSLRYVVRALVCTCVFVD